MGDWRTAKACNTGLGIPHRSTPCDFTGLNRRLDLMSRKLGSTQPSTHDCMSGRQRRSQQTSFARGVAAAPDASFMAHGRFSFVAYGPRLGGVRFGRWPNQSSGIDAVADLELVAGGSWKQPSPRAFRSVSIRAVRPTMVALSR